MIERQFWALEDRELCRVVGFGRFGPFYSMRVNKNFMDKVAERYSLMRFGQVDVFMRSGYSYSFYAKILSAN